MMASISLVRLSVKYETLPPGYERDIFQRVQLGIPLTAAGTR